MSDGFRVDPDHLSAAATSVGAGAQQVAAMVTSLEATVTAQNPWGADEAGTMFASAYLDVLGHAMETFHAHVAMLSIAGENLSAWARTTADADGVADDHIRSIRVDH